MGRLKTMTNVGTSTQMVTGTTYDPANRLLSISGNVLNETRSYNTMGQLTEITSSAVSGSSLHITYNYSSTQNNGKITSQTDNISGEQVVYAYDALNRLASAAATNSSWGQSYAYDGFGNLTDQTVTAGGSSIPNLHVVYNAATNRQTTDCADANGNVNSSSACGSSGYGYDVENRLQPPSSLGMLYAYAPGNKRVWRGTVGTLDEITFWSVTGQKLATYNLAAGSAVYQNNQWVCTLNQSLATGNAYFGGRLISNNTGNVVTDRLGSVGKYYPWGQEKPSATTNGTEKFTGYFRDAETGNDYAKNRYHQPGMGRFLSPDPYQQSAGPSDPGSWNRYAYVGGDPINRIDPSGRDWCPADSFDPDSGGDPCTDFPLVCAPGLVLNEYGVCSLNIQINIPSIPTGTTIDESSLVASVLQSDEASGLVTGFSFDSGTDLSTVDLSSSGAAALGSLGTFSFTTATAGTLGIGGVTVGWSINSLGQLILSGLNFLGVAVLSQVLVQPLGSKDELCYEQYEEDIQVCAALKSAACYDQAMQRYAACIAGKPLPPFPYNPPSPGVPPRRPRKNP